MAGVVQYLFASLRNLRRRKCHQRFAAAGTLSMILTVSAFMSAVGVSPHEDIFVETDSK